jgi:hypothetical protein
MVLVSGVDGIKAKILSVGKKNRATRVLAI